MNIFWLALHPKESVQYYCDKHVVKMLLETVQLMSTTCRYYGLDCGYKSTHINHPCAVWARSSLDNYIYLEILVEELNEEFKYRFKGVDHKSFLVYKTLIRPNIESKGLQNPPLCMPEQYKIGNAVDSYRAYYIGEKWAISSWTKRKRPWWWVYGYNIR